MRTQHLVRTAAVALLVAGASACSSSSGSTPAAGTSSGAATAAASSSQAATRGGSATPSAAASVPSGQAPASSTTPGAVVTTPVAPPTPGSIHQTVAAQPVKTAAPVAVGATAKATQQVAVTVDALKHITTKATVPGDIAGPAVEVDVTIANTGTTSISLDQVTVNVTGSGNTPGEQQLSAPAKPFQGTLAAGRKASAVYVFRIAKEKSASVRVDVSATPQGSVTTVNGKPA